MKLYPSIPSGLTGFADKVDVFDKLDGSNLRVEWARKTGWCKFGTRKRLFDETDALVREAIPVFHTTLAEPLARIAQDARWLNVTVFCEFFGPSSFAGNHLLGEPKTLVLFDVCPYKKGLLGPSAFRRTFEGAVPTAAYLGKVNWTPGYIQRVWNGEVEGLTFEGVVAKSGEGHNLRMAKAKTRAWIEKLKSAYADRVGELE